MKCNQCNFINEINEDKCSNCGCDLMEQNSFHEENIVDENVIDTNNTEEKENNITEEKENNISNKKWGPVLILCLLLGLIGFHRFYVGKAGTAIFMLLTLGGFGIWTLVDLIIIIIGEFTDEDGKKIKRVRASLVEVA